MQPSHVPLFPVSRGVSVFRRNVPNPIRSGSETAGVVSSNGQVTIAEVILMWGFPSHGGTPIARCFFHGKYDNEMDNFGVISF